MVKVKTWKREGPFEYGVDIDGRIWRRLGSGDWVLYKDKRNSCRSRVGMELWGMDYRGVNDTRLANIKSGFRYRPKLWDELNYELRSEVRSF